MGWWSPKSGRKDKAELKTGKWGVGSTKWSEETLGLRGVLGIPKLRRGSSKSGWRTPKLWGRLGGESKIRGGSYKKTQTGKENEE